MMLSQVNNIYWFDRKDAAYKIEHGRDPSQAVFDKEIFGGWDFETKQTELAIAGVSVFGLQR